MYAILRYLLQQLKDNEAKHKDNKFALKNTCSQQQTIRELVMSIMFITNKNNLSRICYRQ